MRRAGRIVAEVLALVESELKPGVSTGHLDRIAERYIRAQGATPSFKGYHGYPASACASRSTTRSSTASPASASSARARWSRSTPARSTRAGTATARGRSSWAAPSPRSDELVETTRAAMMAGIAAAVPGARIGDIGAAVEGEVHRRGHGYGIVRQYVGHGIGTAMHEEPQVPNFGVANRGMQLVPGICLAIEPMFTLGSHEVETRPDGWTVVTRDGSLAAHFEHTIAVTEQGPEILTTV